VVQIRESVPTDAPVLETIQHTALASPWPELLDRAGDGVFCLVATLPPATKRVTQTMPETETIVGYALALDGEQCYLAEIAVLPDHRREGYGSVLLESVVEQSDADELLLTARADDMAAKAFYETHGFCVIDRLPDHYDDGSDTRDGLLLSKPIE
jgi:ribosomal-protein-alanine N-acetyltransferase